MENKSSNKRRKSRADLSSVARKLDTEEDQFLEVERQSPASKRTEKQLLQKIVKMLSPSRDEHDLSDSNQGPIDNGINMADPQDESNLGLTVSDGVSVPNLSGAVQVTTVAHIPSIQHPVELRKVEQLVQNYEQQATSGATLKPVASFPNETARQGMQLRISARLATANPPECIRKPLTDMLPQELLQVVRLLYPANTMAVNSGSSQVLAEVKNLQLTHSKFAEWESAAISSKTTARAHSLDMAEQKRIVSQAVKATRDGHPKSKGRTMR